MTSLGTAGSLPLSTHPQKAKTREGGGDDADVHEMQMQMHEIAKRKRREEEPRAKEKNETEKGKRKSAKADPASRGRHQETDRLSEMDYWAVTLTLDRADGQGRWTRGGVGGRRRGWVSVSLGWGGHD